MKKFTIRHYLNTIRFNLGLFTKIKHLIFLKSFLNQKKQMYNQKQSKNDFLSIPSTNILR